MKKLSRHTLIRLTIVGVILLFVGFKPQPKNAEQTQIKLVLQITVDGLRADLIDRYKHRFVDGGFNHLLKNGAVYTNAHYQHANTETIVGHTTLATGTFPSEHGMVGNVWYDHESGEIAYNIEDPQAPILPSRENLVEGVQVDPSQKISRTKGRSPRAILSTTLGDEIYKNSAGKAKVFGVSGKDRSAVAMAGHMGKAFWFSTDNGDFVTSTYYYKAYPSWVTTWNKQRKAQNLGGTSWTLLHELNTYKMGDRDNRPYEIDLKGYGRVFPHQFGKSNDPLLPTRVLVSPRGDELTRDFLETLINNEAIGKDDITEYLSVSFSGVDAVNHFFGPSSVENEDVVLQLDQTLKGLFEFIDTNIGLDHTLIVLSADHGMAEMPEYMTELGYDVGRIYDEELLEIVNTLGKNIYGIDGIAKSFFRPSLYLDHKKIETAGLNLTEVAQNIASQLSKTEGIALAVAKSGLNNLEQNTIYQQIKNNYHPLRSGDIYVAQAPYWFLFEKGPIGVMHGSPWAYDTHVPIIFAGPGIKNSTHNRAVHPVDVAPSVANYLKIGPPSASIGTPLNEINNSKD